MISKNIDIYFRRWLYNHEQWKVKNALREGVINLAKDLKNLKVSKKQTKDFIAKLEIPESELESLTSNIKPEYYLSLPKQIESWLNRYT
ncbi:hypothetical protein GYA19_00285 [Candidatus Beckwithbacteria bacterium]|nr:hypothetical protein [Candidatus Beckwithbacteria bacterium]